jgi:tetratricopeptide (TPR) repeat protein
MKSPILSFQYAIDQPLTHQDLWHAAALQLQLGHFNQSLQLAYAAVQNDPSYQSRYLQLQADVVRLGAEFAEEIGDYPKAAYYWEQWVQQQPHNVDALYGLGIAKANVSDYRGAAIALREVLRLQPGHDRARSHLATIQQLIQSP